MKDNIFKSDRNQDGSLENIHSDAFEIIDTGSNARRKNETTHNNQPSPEQMNAEMLITMQEFEDRLDNVDCAEEVEY